MNGPLVIDTDMGVDDAAALLLVASHARDRLIALTTTYGNVSLTQATQNALDVLHLLGLDAVAVCPGCSAPLVGQTMFAYEVHGPNGLGGCSIARAPREASTEHGVDALLRLSHEHPGELSVVTLGPLTNLALALAKDRTLPKRLRSVVAMAGTADAVGNTSAVAEFNVANDPEAAKVVFAAGLPLTMVGYDACRQAATISTAEIDAIAHLGTQAAELLSSMTGPLESFCRRVIHSDGYDLPDPLAVAIALRPDLVTSGGDYWVDVETAGSRSRGMTIVDHLGIEKRTPTAFVVTGADEVEFKKMFMAALRTPLRT
jgi:purine nucleosidase